MKNEKLGLCFCGAFFVFSRPTPFSGQGIGETYNRYTIIYKGDAKAINSNDTDPIGGYTKSNTAVTSVTDAIKTPNTYYYYGSNRWFSVDISLWSDYGTNKSIYDPCPYGYRVPKSGDDTASSWYGFTGATWPHGDINGGIVMSSTWWSASGSRNYASGAINFVGTNGYYWSSTRYSSAYGSYNLSFYCLGSVSPSAASSRSEALSVRCVQERGNASRGTWDVGLGSVGVLFFAGIPRQARDDTEGRRVVRR